MFVLWNPVMSFSQLYTWVLLPHAESRSALQLLDTSIASFPPGSISPPSLLNLPLAIVPDGLCSLWNAKSWPGDWTCISLHQRLVPSASFLFIAPAPSVVMDPGAEAAGGGRGGGGQSDRDTLLKVLCTAPVKTPNQMKTNGHKRKQLPLVGLGLSL